MNSHIVNCLGSRPELAPATARPHADTSPYTHASSGWGEAPLSMQQRRLGERPLLPPIERGLRVAPTATLHSETWVVVPIVACCNRQDSGSGR